MCLQEPIFQQVAAVPAIVPQLTHLKPSHLLPYQLLLALQVMIILLLVSKQWGYVAASASTQTNKTVTFLLAVTTTFAVLRTLQSNVDVGAFLRFLGYISKSGTGFTYNIQGTDRINGFDWVAICKV